MFSPKSWSVWTWPKAKAKHPRQTIRLMQPVRSVHDTYHLPRLRSPNPQKQPRPAVRYPHEGAGCVCRHEGANQAWTDADARGRRVCGRPLRGRKRHCLLWTSREWSSESVAGASVRSFQICGTHPPTTQVPFSRCICVWVRCFKVKGSRAL